MGAAAAAPRIALSVASLASPPGTGSVGPAPAGRNWERGSRANGLPAFATYRRDEASGEYRALSIQVIESVDGQIASIIAFLDASLFHAFGLPTTLTGTGSPGC